MPIYKTKKKNKEGLYQYRVTFNYTDKNGKYRQLMRLAYGAAEAKFLEAQLQAKATDNNVGRKTLTIRELYNIYIDAKRQEVRETSLNKSVSILERNILPFFESVKLDKLTLPLLQEWKNDIAKLDLSIVTKKNMYKEFSAMLNFAVKMEFSGTNPLTKLGNFKDAYNFEKPEDKIQYYTVEEFKKFIEAAPKETASDYAYYTFFNIAFYTGMRKGEINALRWSDINGSILSVNRSVAQKIKGKDNIFTPPKNPSSQRKLQIPKPLLKILKQQKRLQQQEYTKWNEDMLVCGGEIPLRDSSLSNKNIEFSKSAGVRTLRIHDFRHTHATLLINEGINAGEIARRLGHSNVTTTLKVYAHLYPREEERALQVLNAIL